MVTGLGLAQPERMVDRLHGFAVGLPEGWKVSFSRAGLLFTDLESVVLVRGMPLKSPREAVKPLLEEAKRLGGGQATFHFKRASRGLMLLAQGLAYPLAFTQGAMGDLALFALEPQVQAVLSGLRYEATHLLLPGPKAILAVSAYLPRDLPEEKRGELGGLLRSLEFLDPKDRVPYRMEPSRTPSSGFRRPTCPSPRGTPSRGAW